MTELTDADAELAHRYLPEHVRGDVEADAWDRVLTDWEDDRPDDLDRLGAAAESGESSFAWDAVDLTFERSQTDGELALTPQVYATDVDDDVYEAARDWAFDVADAVRTVVRERQEATNFGPREFVAFVLSRSSLTYEEAAREMDISGGTYSSKMSREVSATIEAAEATVAFVDRFED